MSRFTIVTTHTRRTIADIEYDPFFDVWICTPTWCDMSLRDTPVDGYTFKAPGEWVSVHRASLHHALQRLAEEGETSISIRGLRYLRRLANDPLPPPQPMERMTAQP